MYRYVCKSCFKLITITKLPGFIGMRVGLLQAAVGIISILKKYEITLNPHSKVEVDRTIFLSPRPDGKLDFKKLKIDAAN